MNKEQIIAELKGSLQFFKNTTSCLTEEDANFAPKEGTFTVTAQIAHTALTVRWFVEGAFEREDSFCMDFEEHHRLVAEVTSYEQALKLLDDEFQYAADAFSAKTEEELNAPIEKGEIMVGQPKWSIITGIIDHTAHHRGSLATYARLIGKEPMMPYAA